MYGIWSASCAAHRRSSQVSRVVGSAGALAMTGTSSAIALLTAVPIEPEELSTGSSAGECALQPRMTATVSSTRSLAASIVVSASGSGLDEAQLGVLKDGSYLIPRHARKPLQELVDAGAGLEVLEQGLDGDTGALEQPGTTDFAGLSFDHRALAPVEHRLSVPQSR